MPIRSRTIALASAVVSAVVLLTGCAVPGVSSTPDTTPRDDPATPPPTITDPLPRPWRGEALWTAPFSSEPKAVGSSFVGVVQDREGGDVHFLGVDREGRTRWSARRDPECTGFAVTHSTAEESELVVLLDKERDPEQGFLGTRTSASAYDPDTGELVWGPSDVPGTLVGPGLVFAAVQGSVMSDRTGPKVALDPNTGDVVADEQDGDTVLHEHHGALLVYRDGALRAFGPHGQDLWDHDELDVPDEVGSGPVRVRYGPRPASDSGAALTLTWVSEATDGAGTGEADEPLLYTVHDLRTGQRLLTLDPGQEPELLGDGRGRTVVLAVPIGEDEPRIHGTTASDSAPVWELPATSDERLRDLVGGSLYTTDGERHRVVDADTGAVDLEGDAEHSDLVPLAALDDGPVILSVTDENEEPVLAAVPTG